MFDIKPLPALEKQSKKKGLTTPTPHPKPRLAASSCLPSGSRVASSSLAAVRGGRATLTVKRDSRTAASSQAHEPIPLVGDSAPHTPLLHLPLDTDPIWGGPPNHQLLQGWPVTHRNSPNHLGCEVRGGSWRQVGDWRGIKKEKKIDSVKTVRPNWKKLFQHTPWLHLQKVRRTIEATETLKCFKMLSNKPHHTHTEKVRQPSQPRCVYLYTSDA